MATAPELIATTANDSDESNASPEAVTGEVIQPGEQTETATAVVPAVDPSLDSGRSLEELEGVIERSIESQIQAGVALLEIQARGMYKEKGFDSFTGYLQGRWGYLSAGYKLMDAAKVQLALTDGGRNEDAVLPKNEAQAREIAPLVRKNPEAARQVWNDLTTQHDAGQLTAQDIRHVVQAKLAELRPATPERARVERPDADTDQMGTRDKSKRYASFYGDDTLIGAHIAPSAADVIVMPVTNRRNLEARISDLAETAVSRLRKGGSLFLVTSPNLLPQVFAGVSDLLNYKWTLIESLDVAVQDRDDKPTIVNGYRAIVWFTKGKYTGEPVNDIVDSEAGGFKELLEMMTPEDGIIGSTHFEQSEAGDVMYLLNQKRRVVIVSSDKTFLATMDHNARAQNYLPENEPSAAESPETGEVDEEDASVESDGEG